MPERREMLEVWLNGFLGSADCALTPASGDASFRRYWRVEVGGQSFVAMDVPPDKEDVERFIGIAGRLRALGLNAPEIHAQDLDQGFLLLTDLGDRLYLDVLDDRGADRLYGDAMSALAVMQACVSSDGLPIYDGAFLRREMELFREWLLVRHLGLELTAGVNEDLDRAFEIMTASALSQPRVFVHRDFHSRNLLITDPPSPGILDFQDAVLGPVTYDLVSLLRDCYIAWPEQRVADWAQGYFVLAMQSGILRESDLGQAPAWFDLMGVQRHLKASGIFARLHIRDGKSGYLADIPRTLGYVVNVGSAYPDLQGLVDLIRERVLPALPKAPL